MDKDQAETAITISALTTFGVFAIRKTIEPGIVRSETAQPPSVLSDYVKLFGASPPLEWGQFLKAAGSLYIVLSILGAASPEIGGGAAILIGTVSVITNGVAVMNDLRTGTPGTEAQKQATTGSKKVKSLTELPRPTTPGQPFTTLAPITP